jgi:tripeptidyl-peptidase-1
MLRYLTLTLVAAAASARVIMDSLAATPKGWEAVRRASLDEAIFLRIALKQQRGDTLDQAVLEMSTPGHPNYGMHMTRDEVRSYTSPSDAAISATTQWLSKHGIQPVVDHDWISFITTVRTANELLDTQFAWYQYSQGNDSPKLRALSYSVPDQVAQHIDLVQPTTRFGNLGARKSTIFEVHRFDLDDAASGPANKINLAPAIADGARCDTFVTPECLKTMYNIHYTPPATADNKIAFGSFLEEYARYDDLRLFQSAYAPGAIGQNLSVELVNGGLDDQNSDSDSSMTPFFSAVVVSLTYKQWRQILTPSTSSASAIPSPS